MNEDRPITANRIFVFTLMLVIGVAEPALSADHVIDHQHITDRLIPLTGNDAPRSLDLHVAFKLNSAILTGNARRQLFELATALKAKGLQGLRIDINGHTDAAGSGPHNQKLSEARAATVRHYLVNAGAVRPDQVRARGFGESRLIPGLPATSGTHRRVEIVAYPPAPAPAGAGPQPDTTTQDNYQSLE